MINAIPFVGWALTVFFAINLAVPFWFVWTVCGIGRTFAYWLPPVYLDPGFWECVGLFIAVSIIKAVFIPHFANLGSNRTANDR